MKISDYYKQVISKLGHSSTRVYIENCVIPALSDHWNDKNIYVIEAPTGYGKTSISLAISLFSVNEEMKAIIAYPQRSLLESQYQVFEKIFNNKILGKRYMFNPESIYLLKPVTLTTIDTLSLNMFGVPPEDLSKAAKHSHTPVGSWGHYLFSVASVGLSNIVLDEVHIMADSTKSLNFLIMLSRFAIDCGRKLIIMSATMPNAVKKIIKDGLRTWKDKIMFIEFTKDQQKTSQTDHVAGCDLEFVEKRSRKKYAINVIKLSHDNKHEFLEKTLFRELNDNKITKSIIIFNTVKDAVEFYRKIKRLNWAAKIPKLLLHSRFNQKDRENKSNEIVKLKTADSYIIVATQVIEVGIDITSDLMISEIAPACSLIQRLGRFLRYDECQGKVFIWYEIDELDELISRQCESKKLYKVYDWYLTKETLRKLDGSINFHVPFDYKEIKGFSSLLNEVYDNNPPALNYEDIKEMYVITENLEYMSKKSVRFLELNDGSFVREELTVPLIPKKTIPSSSDDYRGLIVPVPFNIFRKLAHKGLVEYVLRLNENNKKKDKALISADFNLDRFLVPFTYVKQCLRNSILAFVANVDYDSEIGLMCDDDF